MTENIAEWYHYVALGQKPLSLLGVLTEQNNQKLRDRIGFVKQEALMLHTTYQTQLDILTPQRKDLDNRIAVLKTEKARTAEQEWELRFLLQKVNHLKPQERKLTEEIAKVDREEEARLRRVVGRMLPEAHAQYAMELRNKQQILQAVISVTKHCKKI